MFSMCLSQLSAVYALISAFTLSVSRNNKFCYCFHTYSVITSNKIINSRAYEMKIKVNNYFVK